MKGLTIKSAAHDKIGYEAPVKVYVKFSGQDEFDANIKALNINYVTTTIPGIGTLTKEDMGWVRKQQPQLYPTRILCETYEQGVDIKESEHIYDGLEYITEKFCTWAKSIKTNGGSLFQQVVKEKSYHK